MGPRAALVSLTGRDGGAAEQRGDQHGDEERRQREGEQASHRIHPFAAEPNEQDGNRPERQER